MVSPFTVPELGEHVKSAVVVKVLVAKGDRIKPEQPVVELETDKAVVEVPSDVEGTVDEVRVKVGDEVLVGQALLTVNTGGSDPGAGVRNEAPGAAETPAAAAPPGGTETPPSVGPVPAAPSVRRVARELGVDLGAVRGSGPHGRIAMDDVSAQAKARAADQRPTLPPPVATGETALPDFSPWGPVDREPMSKVRRLTAERMIRAWTVIPHVTQFARADVTEIEALRQRYKADAERVGGHLSLSVILIKAVAGALKAFPRFNASVDMPRGEMVRKHYYNVGVAMNTDRGLMVPVLRGVERTNLMELAVEFSRLTVKAREGKLTLEEMQGGCFTISNAGALGGDVFAPIVNWPEVAILGMGQTRIEAVYREEEFRPRLMLPLSLSYDHRVIDGADGVRFIRWVVEALEQPVKLLWEG